jgi:hypothetical protein
MATLILGAAGAAAGAALGGPAGALGGRLVGAMVGSMLDQRLLGGGSRAVETARPAGLRLQSGREGAPIPRVFGRMRVTGHVIWASRYAFVGGEDDGGGKGGRPAPDGGRRRTISLAVALCEGPIDRLARVWADGRPMARDGVEMRLHRGAEDQPADPLIAALEGDAPAFRGVSYVVFEALDLGPYGDRIPQFAFEVQRRPRVDAALAARIGAPLAELVRGVALSPGSGEFSLEMEPVRRRLDPGVTVAENAHGPDGRADLPAALDQLQEELPACRSVLLLATWFGDDLRCGSCRIEPRVETRDKATEPVVWRVGGLTRASARPVGLRDGRPVFGGTPSDRGVIAAIREMRSRGLRVVFYPFLMLDVPPGSGLPDPWGAAEQPAYPWRGRITASVAPGRRGSPDGVAAAAAEVARFFGAAAPGDFAPAGDTVAYRGPAEWSLRRFVLHYAHLCAMAGGVDAFCIASELRGLTTLRAGSGDYPAVEALRALARDVRAVLGPSTKLGYAADWSEYYGHHPQDGSGDVRYHLDPLWTDPAIDFVGVDNYMPIADWRDGAAHADAATTESPYALDYLRRGVAGGEGYDWHYPSDADRRAQRRAPITDGAHGEPWVYRYKDLANWWGRAHHERVGGVRSATPTAWLPASKPIWFTEIGCPAVDKGFNQPNLFVDPKSTEHGLPYFSTGARDETAQRRFLQATLGWWTDPANNPVSPVYGGPMVDPDAIHVWTWDARPWPEFPGLIDVWSDGDNHRLGHWINGRVASAGLAELVAALCAEAGVVADVEGLHGVVPGYLVEATQTARQSLQPLMLAFGFDAIEAGGGVRFRMRGGRPVAAATADDCVAPEADAPSLSRTRASSGDGPRAVRLGHLDADGDYEPAAVETRGEGGAGVEASDLPLALDAEAAGAAARRWLAEAGATAETARLRLPPSRLALEPGDVIEIRAEGPPTAHRVDRITDLGALEVETTAVAATAPVGRAAPRRAPRAAPATPAGPPAAILIDAPGPSGRAPDVGPLLAVFAEPWPGDVAVWRSVNGEGWREIAVAARPATVGEIVAPPASAAPDRWAVQAMEVRLYGGGALRSASRRDVLDGANVAAIETAAGWEMIQFAGAEMTGPGRWRLSGLLRGQAGTAGLPPPAPGARFVRLDSGVLRLPWEAAELGLARLLRIGERRRGFAGRGVVQIDAAPEGAGLLPLPPCRLRISAAAAAAAAGGDVAAGWSRRSRLDADGWGAADAPQGEAREAWRARVVVAGRTVRVIETAAPALVYTAAQRVADGAAGAFELRVAQLSDIRGPGPETGATWHG